MKKIKLTQGFEAIVDDSDFEWLSQWKWFYEKGYAKTWIKGKRILMHRWILSPAKYFVTDHINFNKLDNREKNLRIVTRAENNIHREKYKINKTGYKGVKYRKGLSKPFMARIRVNKYE